MSGFLDCNVDVIDFQITREGRRLLSENKLEFVYYSFFDDEVDYDPYVANSASLSDDDLAVYVENQIIASPVRQAIAGYERAYAMSASDTTNVRSNIFSVPQGTIDLVRIFDSSSSFSEVVNITLNGKQRAVKKNNDVGSEYVVGFERYMPGYKVFDIKLAPDSAFFDEDMQSGYIAKFFKKNEVNEYVEVDLRLDEVGRISILNELTVGFVSEAQDIGDYSDAGPNK